MPRKFFRRMAPSADYVREHRLLGMLGHRLHDPALWHLNRRSVAGAFAAGLFTAMLPMPAQMLFAATLALIFRVNLPLAAILVWVTNPLTMPPTFYSAYRLGCWVLGWEPLGMPERMNLDWFIAVLSQIWVPLWLGALMIAPVVSLAGYFGVRLSWRLAVISQLRSRRERRRG